MTTRAATRGFRHGLRVRMGRIDGPRGVLLECRAKHGGTFWKVRLQHGVNEWVWPEALGGIIVDGDGDQINPRCASCELPFIVRAGSGELICARCDVEQFGSARDRADEPSRSRRYDNIRRHRGEPA